MFVFIQKRVKFPWFFRGRMKVEIIPARYFILICVINAPKNQVIPSNIHTNISKWLKSLILTFICHFLLVIINPETAKFYEKP